MKLFQVTLYILVMGGEFGQWAQSKIPFGRMFVNGLSGAIVEQHLNQ